MGGGRERKKGKETESEGEGEGEGEVGERREGGIKLEGERDRERLDAFCHIIYW